MPDLKDRTAVVTGASSGIGAETARALAGAGARLMLGARRMDRLDELVKDLPGEGHITAPLDVTDEESCASFVESAAGALGRIDILVNNAGLALGRTSVEESNDDDDRQMLETNVLGLVRMTRLVLPHMEDGRGHIVNLGSWAGREAYPQGGMYVGSKTAVLALTRVMRRSSSGASRSRRSTRAWSAARSSPTSASAATRSARMRSIAASTTSPLPTWLIASSSP